MSEFTNVTVVREANVYFDGAVTSRVIRFPGGEVKTLGIMMPGEYTFSTGQREIMEIQAGAVEVRLPGEEQWCSYRAGEQFAVAGNAAFDIRVLALTDYCCSYLD